MKKSSIENFSGYSNFLLLTKRNKFILFAPVLTFLLLPSTNSGLASLSNWADQSTYVVAYKEWLGSGQSAWLENNWVGPGFIALIRILRLPFSSVEVALIQASFIGIFSGILLLSKQTIFSGKILKLNVFLILFVLSTHLPVFKDIPWTHLWVLPMLLFAVLLLDGAKTTKTKNFLIGFLLVFAWQIRNFETIAVIVAIVSVTAALKCVEVLRKQHFFREDLKVTLAMVSGIASSFLFVGLLSRHFYVFRQYKASEDFSPMPPSIDLNPINLLHRFIQLFFEPTFQSLSGYVSDSRLPISDQIVVRGENLTTFFGQSLSRQQPMLLPLMILSIVIMLISIFQFIKNGIDSSYTKLVLALGLAGLLIIFGYLSQPMIGSGHLKFGIAREFLLPQFLFAAVVIASITHNKWLNKSLLPIILMAIGSSFLINLPDSSYRDYRFELGAKCGVNQSCSASIDVMHQTGQWKTLGIQELYILDKCGMEETYYFGKSDGFVTTNCLLEHSVSVIPTAFGLASTTEAQTILNLKKMVL